MEIIIITILAILCYLALCQIVGGMAEDLRIRLAVDVVLLIMYAALMGLVGIIYLKSGYNGTVIFDAFVMAGIIFSGVLIWQTVKYRRSMNIGWMVAFALYFALVIYLTLWIRAGKGYSEVHTDALGRIRLALETHSLEPVMHMIANVLFFVPFGYIIPKANEERFDRFGYSLLSGVAMSTAIEGLQLVFQLGDSDTGDILANSVGVILGYGFFWLLRQIGKNWHL